MTDDALNAAAGGFVIAGGGNLICRLDPSSCSDFEHAKSNFVRTIFAHPLEWYSIKFGLFGRYWFNASNEWTTVSGNPSVFDVIANASFLIAGAISLLLLATKRLRSDPTWGLAIWLTTSLLGSYFLMFTVQQFETRYLYFPKIICLFALIVTAAVFWGSKKLRND